MDVLAGCRKHWYAKPVIAFRKAWKNLDLGKKKIIVVVLSPTLSPVILNIAFAFFQTFDFDEYVSSELLIDFK